MFNIFEQKAAAQFEKFRNHLFSILPGVGPGPEYGKISYTGLDKIVIDVYILPTITTGHCGQPIINTTFQTITQHSIDFKKQRNYFRDILALGGEYSARKRKKMVTYAAGANRCYWFALGIRGKSTAVPSLTSMCVRFCATTMLPANYIHRLPTELVESVILCLAKEGRFVLS